MQHIKVLGTDTYGVVLYGHEVDDGVAVGDVEVGRSEVVGDLAVVVQVGRFLSFIHKQEVSEKKALLENRRLTR